MRITKDRIIAAVRAEPSGQTTHELATRLGASKKQVGSALSKLACYGKIDVTYIRRGNSTGAGPNKWCVWRPLQAAE